METVGPVFWCCLRLQAKVFLEGLPKAPKSTGNWHQESSDFSWIRKAQHRKILLHSQTALSVLMNYTFDGCCSLGVVLRAGGQVSKPQANGNLKSCLTQLLFATNPLPY